MARFIGRFASGSRPRSTGVRVEIDDYTSQWLAPLGDGPLDGGELRLNLAARRGDRQDAQQYHDYLSASHANLLWAGQAAPLEWTRWSGLPRRYAVRIRRC